MRAGCKEVGENIPCEKNSYTRQSCNAKDYRESPVSSVKTVVHESLLPCAAKGTDKELENSPFKSKTQPLGSTQRTIVPH
jgi:hypothetical protein